MLTSYDSERVTSVARAGEGFLSTVTAPTAHHGKIRLGRELGRADHANYGTLMSYTDNTASKIKVTGCHPYYAHGAFDYAKDS